MLVLAFLVPRLAAAGWLIAFIYVSAVPLGCLELMMIHRLTGGSWGDELTADAGAGRRRHSADGRAVHAGADRAAATVSLGRPAARGIEPASPYTISTYRSSFCAPIVAFVGLEHAGAACCRGVGGRAGMLLAAVGCSSSTA